MGCRTPIRQRPAGILFLKGCDIIGKSEFANPLKDCVLFGKSEFANPLKVSVLFGKERICQPIKGLRNYWQIGICQPIKGLRHYWQIGICQPIKGLRHYCQRRELSFLVQEFPQIGILGNKETRNSQTDTYPTCQIEGIAQN